MNARRPYVVGLTGGIGSGKSAPAVVSAENRWRPFCSERCRMIDLGLWASESYRVPQEDSPPEDPEDGKAGNAGA